MLMERRSLLAASYALDWLIGDPEWMPHPIRGMGWLIATGELILRNLGSERRWELAAGGILAAAVPLASALAVRCTIRAAELRGRVFGSVFEVWLGFTCLATRNLLDEAAQVIRALESNDLELARRRLARIVGRDTQTLLEPEICRATIETLAESLSDGIIAPLFYLALGGVPAGIAYKAVSTLDSMVGHQDAKYLWFGRSAARLDDVANWIPARISAILLCAAGRIVCGRGSGFRAVRIWLRDGSHHVSPNAGQVESAMAGALAVQLGGSNRYGGECIEAAILGSEFPRPGRATARRALRVVAAASLLGFAAAWLLARSHQHGK